MDSFRTFDQSQHRNTGDLYLLRKQAANAFYLYFGAHSFEGDSIEVLGKAVLLGNGLNRVAKLEPSWENIIKDLFHIPRADPLHPRMQKTPFPLLIEEACTPPFAPDGERRVQEQLASVLNEWSPGDIHRDLSSRTVSHILTTNYDLTIERSVKGPVVIDSPLVQETRYSLFRRNRLPSGMRIWHIHGCIDRPASMVLGFEHYSGHLQAIREATVTGRHYTNLKFGPIEKALREKGKTNLDSWLEVALTHDLLMVGISMEFAELGLWWLLTHRARRLNARKPLPRTRIVYACRSSSGSDEAAAREAQLKNCGVEIWRIAGTYEDVHRTALDRFETLPLGA